MAHLSGRHPVLAAAATQYSDPCHGFLLPSSLKLVEDVSCWKEERIVSIGLYLVSKHVSSSETLQHNWRSDSGRDEELMSSLCDTIAVLHSMSILVLVSRHIICQSALRFSLALPLQETVRAGFFPISSCLPPPLCYAFNVSLHP